MTATMVKVKWYIGSPLRVSSWKKAEDIINRGIEKAVDVSLPIFAHILSEKVVEKAKEVLAGSVKSGSGNLFSTIRTQPNDIKRKGYARYDILVGSPTVKYAAWIEFGRLAPFGLPYSKAGGRDYSKSRFKGYKYIGSALSFYSQKEQYEPIFKNIFIKHIKLMKFK